MGARLLVLRKSGRVPERAQLWFGPAPAGHKAEQEASLSPPVLPTHTTFSIRFTPHQWPTTQWRVANTYMTLGRMAVEAAVAT